jgi:nucleoside-diphosphate-sugar epimerase
MAANPQGTTTVLATGCSGFLGRHCAAALVRRGFNVHAVSRIRHGLAADGTAWHKLDLQSWEGTERLIATLRPSHLLHLAWVTAPDRYRHTAENLDWMDASLALVKSFAEQGGRRFVGAGSCAEYEAVADRCIEDKTSIRPASLYGQCKAAFWMGTEAYARHYGFSAAWGRVFLPYGPGDEPRRLVPSLVTALGAGRSIDVTDGSQIRDFVYATDVADLLVRLLETPEATGAYNVGTGDGTTVRQVIERVARHFHALGLVHFGARPGRRDEPPFLVAEMAKVERVLGWRAATSIENGLEELLSKAEAFSPQSAS